MKHQHLDLQTESIHNRLFENLRYIILGAAAGWKNDIARIDIGNDVFHTSLLEWFFKCFHIYFVVSADIDPAKQRRLNHTT